MIILLMEMPDMGEAARGAAEISRRRGLAQNPLTQVRDGPVLHLRIDALVQVVLNDAV